MTITAADAHAALHELGYPPDPTGGRSTCPICRTFEALIVTGASNGHTIIECSNGCTEQALIAVLGAAKSARRNSPDTLTRIKAALDMPTITHIVKHGRGHAYILHLADGNTVNLGNAADLLIRRRIEASILGAAGHLVPAAKPDAHRALVADIEAAADYVDNVLSDDEETLGLLADYLEANRPTRGIDVDDKSGDLYEALTSKQPFTGRDERLYLRIGPLCDWLGRMGQRITHQEMSGRLARLGFERPGSDGQIAARRGERVVNRRLWVSPIGIEDRL